ncbi:MAG TPA: iron donor protein CyaY [Polyangiales bacterium]|nr:iron donor protein CyaY [Polyangiales bacterium]
MDESEFERRAAEAWKRVIDLFEDVDPEDADVEQAGDVIRIDFRGGQRVVLNTQRPARQLWLAGGAHAWHFSYEPQGDRWLDDKGRGVELYAQLAALAKEAAGIDLAK